MLMVKIVNTGDGTDEVANYKYEVYVNTRCIATGLVNGHVRGDGWQKLAHAVARDAEQRESRGEDLEQTVRVNELYNMVFKR